MREDFYYRIAVVPLFIEPLRERPKEIDRLARFFLQELNGRYGRKVVLESDAVLALQKRQWPGNIRELKNVIDFVVATSPTPVIHASNLPQPFIQHEKQMQAPTLKEAVVQLEQAMITQALHDHKTTRKAAEALGISQAALVTKRKNYSFD